MSRFHNAMFLGDAEERMRVLEATGQLSLAYLCAATHGLDEDAARLRSLLEAGEMPVPPVPEGAALLQPPTPILRGENWPLLAVAKSALGDMDQGGNSGVSGVDAGDVEDTEPGGDWGDDDLFDDEDGGKRHGLLLLPLSTNLPYPVGHETVTVPAAVRISRLPASDGSDVEQDPASWERPGSIP